MKKLIMVVSILVSSSVFAGWGNVFSSTNLTGCAVGAAGGYGLNMNSSDALVQAQGAAVGCAVGGLITYFVDGYFEKKYAVKERDDKQKLMNVLRQYQRQDASNTSEDPNGRFYVDKEVIPSQKHPDGSISMEHLRLRIRKAGSDLLLGE